MATPIADRQISCKGFIGHYVASLIPIAILAMVFASTGMWLLFPLAALPAAGVFLYSQLMKRSSSYRLYPDRLEVESGLLSRQIENVELFRVRDVGLRQGFFGRLADYGDVYIHSTDSSTPDVHVRSIDKPKDFYQQVRELVSASRAHHRTVIMEETHALAEP